MKRILILAAAALLPAACATTGGGDRDALDRTIRNQDATIDQLELRNDELTAEKIALRQRVAELEAALDKVRSTEEVVEQAKGEISEHVRQVLERFKGDSDIEVERTEGGYRFVLREAVLFASGSATLTEEGRTALARVAEALRGGRSRIQIEGHTDDVPVAKPETLEKFPRGNVELSTARALAVWEYLSKEGQIDPARMAVSGYGAHRPRVPNDSERNRWRNRRVEIQVAEE